MALMIEALSARIWAHEEFHSDIASLKQSAAFKRYIGDDKAAFDTAAMRRLLKSAAALSASTNTEHRETAYQIASAAAELEGDASPGIPYLLLLVLSRIGNFPALSYARKRFGIDEYSLPTRSVAETVDRSEGNSVDLGPGLVRLTDFQLELWRELTAGGAVGVSAPTSAGKSFILQAYAQRLVTEQKVSRVVFLVPTRALINQVSDDIAAWLVNDQTGAELVTTPVPKGASLPERAVFVVTQERLQLLQSAHPDLLFELMVVDEAQSLGDGPRGVLLSSVIDEALTRNPKMQLLFAGPNLRNPAGLSRLFGKEPTTVSTKEATVIQNIVFVDCDDARPEYATVSIRSQGERVRIGEVDFEQPLIDHKSKLVNIALKLGAGGQNLVYALGPAECETIAVSLADNDATTDNQALLELSEFIKEAVHPKYQLSNTVLQGVGFHYGRLPSLVRKSIEDAFSDGLLQYLVTTSTLLYGVNLPAQNLFLHNPQKGTDQPLSSNDFWNLAGRAGRLGKEFTGNIFLVDYGDWPTDPMAGEKDRIVVPAIEQHLLQQTDELTAYIGDPGRVPNRDKPDELENTFVKLVRDHLDGRLSETLTKVGLDLGDTATIALVKAVEASLIGTNIDENVLTSSPTVSIHRQQSLYEWLDKSLKAKGAAHVIPKHPLDSKAYQSYLTAIKRCHGAILKYPTADKSHSYYAQLALRWMRGDPLPRIIDANAAYIAKQGRSSNLATIIRNTLTEVESDLRFKYVRLFSCYNAVLDLVLRDNGMGELSASIPSVPMYLELGACSPSMISFMGLGLSRYTASKVSSIPRRTDMSQQEARTWIKRQDLEALNLPSASIREIRRLVVG
jgi:hypothetical protein